MNFFMLSFVYLVLDAIWISIMTPLLYKKVFENIQGSVLKPKFGYAVICYFILLLSIYYICIPLSSTYSKCRQWMAYSLVGFTLYSIFNLTNAAVFDKYSMKMIVIDSLWGTIVFGLVGLLNSKL